MKVFIAVTILSTLSMSSAFAQPSSLSYDTHRFVDNATVFPHIEVARHEQPHVKISKASVISFSEMNEHERAIIAHPFMNNNTSYAHRKMIEGRKKKLNKSETNTTSSSFSESNTGNKTTPVHERINNTGAEVHQIQARNLRELYEDKE